MDTTAPPRVITDRAIQSSIGPFTPPGTTTAMDLERLAGDQLAELVTTMALTHQLKPREAIGWLRRILNQMEAEHAIAALADAEPIVRDSDDYGCDLCCRPEGCPNCRPWPGAHRYIDPSSPY